MTIRKSFTFDPLFDSLAKVMNVGTLVLGSDREVDFASERALELFGCASEDELRRRWAEITDGQLFAPPAEDRVLGRKRDVQVNLNVGSRRLRLELFQLDEEECRGSLVVVKDRQSLDALQTDLRLASRFRVLRNVWVGAAHDLKAPLNAMSISADLLKDSLASDSDEDAEAKERRNRYLDVIGEETVRLRDLVDKLLRQAAPPSDEPREWDLNEQLEVLVKMLRPQTQRYGVHLVARTPEKDAAWTGNFAPIREALLNLAVNALEAVGEGGRIEISFERSGDELVFGVKDNGPGIEAALLERIFEMHFTTKASGTGIGLYVTRQIIESHGGRIDVETQVGEGTCFHIRLPSRS